MLPPTILVVFGITGDLSRRYLLPALNQINQSGQLPAEFKILGISRRDVKVQDFLPASSQSIKDKIEIFQLDLGLPDNYHQLKTKITELSKSMSAKPQVIFYMVVPPVAVPSVVENLGKAGLNGPKVKLLLEKPFGFDTISAKDFTKQITKYFHERQVYRIDHYSAKEMSQNITVFLGANSLFKDVWNNQFIESIEITAAEEIGIEKRIDFYESTGALRDFVQSHLVYLTSLILMKPFDGVFDFEQLPRRRLEALKKLKTVNPQDARRAQYKGYADEVSNPGSPVETFASVTVYSKDPVWQGVPITLTTGKKLDKKLTAIRVRFKSAGGSRPNLLVLRIQPHEGIEIGLWVKEPGYTHKVQKLPLKFAYDQHFGQLPQAYEQVLIDAISTRQSLFASSQEVLASWKILQPVLDSWAMQKTGIPQYKPGGTIKEVLEIAS